MRRLTALYLKKGKAKNDRDAASLQVLINRTCSRWVEKHMSATADKTGGGWSAPIVLDSKALAAGGVDLGSYVKV